MLGRTGLNVTTNGTLSDNFLPCRCLESVAVWSKAYFAYFLLDERVLILLMRCVVSALRRAERVRFFSVRWMAGCLSVGLT